MDELEVLVFILSLAIGVIAIIANHLGPLHRLYFRGNPAPGVVRLGVILAMAWIGYVLWRHADPSVTGIYVVFYLVMGYAAVKFFGQTLGGVHGARFRVDVGERRNVPAALVIAGFTLATGLIFGGSLWGEADPVGEDEGGFWIPLSFFLLGWIALVIAFALFLRRERGRFAQRIQRERSLADARAAAVFLLAAGAVLTDAVAGDFWGWRHGLLTFGVLAGLLVAHEFFASWTRPEGPGEPGRQRPGQPQPGPADPRRLLESGAYLLMGAVAWGLNRVFDALWGAG